MKFARLCSRCSQRLTNFIPIVPNYQYKYNGLNRDRLVPGTATKSIIFYGYRGAASQRWPFNSTELFYLSMYASIWYGVRFNFSKRTILTVIFVNGLHPSARNSSPTSFHFHSIRSSIISSYCSVHHCFSSIFVVQVSGS